MKKIIFLFAIIVCQLYFTQEYPLNTNALDLPNGAYIKDMNGELNKYVGLWKGNWSGKTIYLELKKVKEYQSVTGSTQYLYQDVIQGERKVINSNGEVEIDRISTFGQDGPEFRGISTSLSNLNWKRIYFYPKNMCKKYGYYDIINFANTTMTLHFEYWPSFYDENCIHNVYVDQYGDFPFNFPKDITLTKQ